ncbi:tetratricopeptide repeat protein [Neptuniibacter sp.]|jgi:tetratricopeptide (TPR) repeat protein|uniref:tetratricopeptide repeat protein n=1 Tax=Neptuniibacter sp. TaxID=1962643 RepID=UPI003B5A4B67
MRKLITTLSLIIVSMHLAAAPVDDARVSLQKQWAHIKYEVEKDQREKMFETLATASEDAVKQFPDSAEILIWRAIILSTYAGEKGGLGALSLVKEAKALLEQSIEIDPTALQGSAYTSLGSLYYQVPGWPIGFGSDKKAQQYLSKALEINPDGIDSNFFNADFMLEKNDKEHAKALLEHALKAAPRPGREIADNGRRQEIQKLLEKL